MSKSLIEKIINPINGDNIPENKKKPSKLNNCINFVFKVFLYIPKRSKIYYKEHDTIFTDKTTVKSNEDN